MDTPQVVAGRNPDGTKVTLQLDAASNLLVGDATAKALLTELNFLGIPVGTRWIDLAYTSGDLTGVTYRATNGGTILGTRALSYDAPGGNLISIGIT